MFAVFPVTWLVYFSAWIAGGAAASDFGRLGEAGLAFIGIALLYFARVVLRLDKTVAVFASVVRGEDGHGGLVRDLARITENYERVNGMVTVISVTLDNLESDLRDLRQTLRPTGGVSPDAPFTERPR
jgi:hypothetical protein